MIWGTVHISTGNGQPREFKKKKYVFDDTDIDESVYRYMMTIDESFKDDRYHDDDEKPQCRVLDLGTVMRLFFQRRASCYKLTNQGLLFLC